MSCLRATPVQAKALLGALLLTLATAVAACEEDGKTAPANCVDPEPFDIQGKPTPNKNPCVNGIGHAVSSIESPSSGGSATAGSGGGTATADAGAGGAGGAP